MRIIVAGAGAGKTSSMAEEVIARYKQIEDGKIIYVITYTNAARDHIRNKIIEQLGSIPKQIKVETSHVFLLQEFILPFHHLLYDQQYTTVSAINLPDNNGFRAKKIKELKEKHIIHVQEVTNIAKHVICGKSNDRKNVKEKRRKILSIVKNYLDSIFLDEAQDMDEHLSKIIEVFYNNEFNLLLVGDPKQDLRGGNEFRKLIEKYPQNLEYKKENYRCPISHVIFANMYVLKEEKQEYQVKEYGELEYIYEQDIEIKDYIENGNWCHKYIYQKNSRFLTKRRNTGSDKDTLYYELKVLIRKTDVKEQNVEKYAYILTNEILGVIDTKDNKTIINELGEKLSLKLTAEDKARMFAALEINKKSLADEGIVVESIDKVKGLEGDNCLFILTTELSDYLFKEKYTQNKMLNYLYVALTRSKKKLMILVTKEVEEKYGREWIDTKFEELLAGVEMKAI
jgi:hypothetical protein